MPRYSANWMGESGRAWWGEFYVQGYVCVIQLLRNLK